MKILELICWMVGHKEVQNYLGTVRFCVRCHKETWHS